MVVAVFQPLEFGLPQLHRQLDEVKHFFLLNLIPDKSSTKPQTPSSSFSQAVSQLPLPTNNTPQYFAPIQNMKPLLHRHLQKYQAIINMNLAIHEAMTPMILTIWGIKTEIT